MDKLIKRKYEFDEVFDGQSVYRKILKAMSNPGTICDISMEASKIDSLFSAELAVAITLLDNEVSYFSSNEQLNHEVELLTLSNLEDIEHADFAFVHTLEESQEVIEAGKTGTLPDPQKSCTLIYKINDFEEKTMKLAGPGIDGTKEFQLPEQISQVINMRKQMNFDFPLGMDLIFLTEDMEMIAIPRLVKEV